MIALMFSYQSIIIRITHLYQQHPHSHQHPLPELTGLRHLATSRRRSHHPLAIYITPRCLVQFTYDYADATRLWLAYNLRVLSVYVQMCCMSSRMAYPLPYPHFVGCNACLVDVYYIIHYCIYVTSMATCAILREMNSLQLDWHNVPSYLVVLFTWIGYTL